MYSPSFHKRAHGWLRSTLAILTLSLLGCVTEPLPSSYEAEGARASFVENYDTSSALNVVSDGLAQQRAPASLSTGVMAVAVGAMPVAILANPGPQCVYRGAPPVAVSRRRARLRILSQNTFGLDRDGNSNCEARATRIGTIIANASPAYDIVALQEHWNSLDFGIVDCGGDQLEDAIWSTGRYRNSNNYYRQRPEGESWQGETDGGQSIFTVHPIESFDENEWDDIPGAFDQLQGSTFSRIKLNGTNIRVDFYNAHLLAQGADDCNAVCRRKELQELRNEIILHSRTSGNPVIVVGDFNIGAPACAGNDRYADIMELLENPRDLWLEAHPSLNGFTQDCQRNTVLQDVEACSYRERIDFMFLVQSPNLTNSAYVVVLRDANDMRLAEFTRSNGKHVSDHFGIEAILEIRERGRVSTPFVGLAQKCMDVSGGQTADGTPVQLFTCNGSAAQRWTLGHDGQLRGIGGKCLTVSNGSTANRTVTELSTCTGSAAQRFDYTASGELRSHLTANKCVEVRGGFTANGTRIQLYDCNGTASQKWQDR